MFYYVKSGDSLDRIIRKYGISMTELFQYNPVTYYYPLYAGQRLFIPLSDSRTFTIYAMPANNTANSEPKQLITYTIQVGDTLDSIANKFNTTKEAIIKLNGLTSEVLIAGDTLLVTGPKTAAHNTDKERQADFDRNLTTKSKYKFLYLHDLFLDKDIDIWKQIGYNNVYFFVSKMAITAAGAPNAFNKDDDKALDFLANAGHSGNWWSLVTEPNGYPMIQNEWDSYPGYYISKTALSDCNKPIDDPTRYVDAREIPYIVLPVHHMMGAELGDLSVVINTKNGKIAYAIVADIGPDDSLGIGSIALAKELDIDPDAKSGGTDDGILYIVFTQSGKETAKLCYENCYSNCTENCQELCDKECYEKMEKLWCKPKTREQIIHETRQLFEQWGGLDKVKALFGEFPLSNNNIQY